MDRKEVVHKKKYLKNGGKKELNVQKKVKKKNNWKPMKM